MSLYGSLFDTRCIVQHCVCILQSQKDKFVPPDTLPYKVMPQPHPQTHDKQTFNVCTLKRRHLTSLERNLEHDDPSEKEKPRSIQYQERN